MNVQPSEDEHPVSWRALEPSTPVFAADGTEVGTATEVLGWDQEDIFHGLVVRRIPPGDDVMIPAEQLGEMTNRRIAIGLSPEEVANLAPYGGDGTPDAPPTRRGGALGIEETE